MAFTTFFTLNKAAFGLPIGRPTKLYNFDHQVRTFAGGGDKVDVMLLQALFRILYYEFTGQGSFPIPGDSTGVIKVDGIVGPQTRIHIQDFQKLARLQSGTTNGIIDPFRKQGVSTPHTGKPFQLLLLNSECQRIAFGNDRFEVHQRMVDLDVHPDELYPLGLRTALRRPPVVMH